MPSITALCVASIFAFNPVTVPVDPFGGPSPAESTVDPLSTAVPSPEGDAWVAPSPPPPPPPPRRSPAPVVESPAPELGSTDEAPSPELEVPTAPVSAEAANRTITIGLALLGGSVAAGAGSVYSWREKGQRDDQLRQKEQANAIAVAAGGLPGDTSSIHDDIKLYRGLTIGLAVTAGVLALVGGSVALVGLGRRQRAAVVTMRAGGVGVQF